MCRPQVLLHCPMVLEDLQADIIDCQRVLPPSVAHLIRRTRIWINLSYQYGSVDKPRVLNHTTAHHHHGWLEWARDRTDKTLGIEIYSCFDYRRMRLHWNGCGLLLHEFCHLIHQQVLLDGLENARIKKAFGLATVSGLYDTVRRRDWAGQDEDFDLAYAMVDMKEFFAEVSVAFLSIGYQHLDDANPCRILECSPPIIEPTVVQRIQQANIQPRPPGWVAQVFDRPPHRPHCNKFYPFTSGQLRHYDPATYQVMEELWKEIAEWQDPAKENTDYCGCWKRPLPPATPYLDTVDL